MTTEKYIPLHILEEITNEFSEHSIIGRGGYGDVYKGVYNGREIAVKLLHVGTLRGLDDQEFKNEVGNLLKVKHPNIIQLVGYCYATKKIYVKRNGANDFVEHIYRILCFEYMQGGSLDKHLYGQYFAPNWSTRYNIIKGICEGLDYLHKCEPQILHLDLKPANIFLDNFMEPKVVDLGLSRLFIQSHTHVTERIKGTQKYVPPEFVNEGMRPKNDIFSLGVVMMEIMTEPAGYSHSFEMDDVAQLSQQILTNWSTMIEATSKYPSEEIHQVQTCIKLGIHCVDSERDNRPSTTYILDALNKTEINIPKRQLAGLLSFETVGSRNTMYTRSMEIDTRETASIVEEELIIGRTEEKQNILSILSRSFPKEMATPPTDGIGSVVDTAFQKLLQMNRRAITPQSELERMLFDQRAKPKALSLSLLEDITNGFSKDNIIGDGGFAVVYKGVLDNEMVAVKKLSDRLLNEKKFIEEVRCLMKASHKNVVRLLGYCSDTQGEIVHYGGKHVLGDVRQRLLCFEYVPNGSLDKQITDASCGLEWKKRYQIINGLCEGLYYLHQEHIVHRDLKPANILLDNNMEPKIADFGISRCFDKMQSRAITSNIIGTTAYLAPEFSGSNQITFKLDIYSLGQIIFEMLTGVKGHTDIEHILEMWRNRSQKLVQVRVCAKIAPECLDFNPNNRSDMQDIIDRLGAISTDEPATETGASR